MTDDSYVDTGALALRALIVQCQPLSYMDSLFPQQPDLVGLGGNGLCSRGSGLCLHTLDFSVWNKQDIGVPWNHAARPHVSWRWAGAGRLGGTPHTSLHLGLL